MSFKVKPVRTGRIAVALVVVASAAILLDACSSGSGGGGSTRAAVDTSRNYVRDLFEDEGVWIAPGVSAIPKSAEGKMISYGRELFIHTAKYFGPKGSLSHATNGMNCQNCHLDAGTRPYGNNLGAVSTTYPRVSPRSGGVVSVAGKVNECLSRSMNGEPIDTNGKEMQGFVAYIKWLGKDVKKGQEVIGSGGIKALGLLNRAADPAKGKVLYDQLCKRCHSADGQGQFAIDVLKDPTKQQGGNATKEDLYYYPPLWGEHSYNAVATLYRVSKLAGFIQKNMPYPMDYKSAVLTEEQAWDIAAFINSQQRPVKDHSKDYAMDVSKKPYDFPFGPYSDGFSEEQHKYGPYTEMPAAKKGH
jgi:thiosulfate dehydrogenase